jgi:hypothetical protein
MKLYNEYASWWQLMSPAREYAEEAEFYRNTLNSAAAGPLQTLLELLPFEHSELEPGKHEVFLCLKPAGTKTARQASFLRMKHFK